VEIPFFYRYARKAFAVAMRGAAILALTPAANPVYCVYTYTFLFSLSLFQILCSNIINDESQIYPMLFALFFFFSTQFGTMTHSLFLKSN